MKWLLLIILISCGKHEAPKAVDLVDYDGDQKVGEEGFEKFTADFDVMEAVEGTLSFISTEKHELAFTNAYDPTAYVTRLMVGSLSYSERDQFFSEGARLKFTSGSQKVTSEITKINVFFKSAKKGTSELFLVHDKIQRKLGDWEEFMSFSLSKEELEKVLSGKSYLSLKKKLRQEKHFPQNSAESIRDKTHKVVVNDGKEVKIYYVSKSLSRESMYEFLNVKEPTTVTDDSLFFDSLEMSGTKWFIREYENKDIILMLTTLQELKKNFMAKLDLEKTVLKRENGNPVSTLFIENISTRKIYLKIRPSASERSMAETVRLETHQRKFGQGEQESYVCKYFSRSVSAEKIYYPSFEDFLKNLIDPEIESFDVREQQDEKGLFWEVILYTKLDRLSLRLAARSQETYKTTGDYYADCGKGLEKGRRASYQTNVEGFLSFDIESFVERSE